MDSSPDRRLPLNGHAAVQSLVLSDVAVTDGGFVVGLDFPDLPAGIRDGWLEVAVQSGDEGNWETLEGRSEVLLDGLVCPTPWGLEGNAGTNSAINFLGTTDNAALSSGSATSVFCDWSRRAN